MSKVLMENDGYLRDKDGEFGFIAIHKNKEIIFKLTKEKYLTIEEMEEITSYMRTMQKVSEE